MRQKLNLITLGVHDLQRSVAFFEGPGWKKREASIDSLALFPLEGIVLALHPWKDLANDTTVSEQGELGATIIKQAQKFHWEGFSGYFKDFDGHLFEVAYNPFRELDKDDNLLLH
jgi:uncharacterized protein